MNKSALHAKKYRKRTVTAGIIILSLLAAGCGSPAVSDHSQHAVSNVAVTDEHRGHTANAQGDEMEHDTSENHSGHNRLEQMSAADIKLEWRYSPVRPGPGKETNIELFLYDHAGKAIEKYEVNHEKLMHLILVSEDLKDFMHIHPEYKGKGKFEVAASFNKSGNYKLYADFIPTGSPQMTVASHLQVSGAKQAQEPLKKDKNLTKIVDGIAVSLKISSFKADQETDLIFTLSDEKTKEPISDLQPYLGAIGHVVILSEDRSRYLHVHPKDDNRSGPTAEFSTRFPEPGLYKMWGQFQRGGKTFIVPFIIEAE